MKILVVMDVDAKQTQWLEMAAPEADFCYCPGDGTQAGKALEDADIIIGNIAPDLVKKASQLKWLQLNSAGANEYCRPGILQAGVTLTNATGAYGLALSEHMLAQTLAMMKKLYLYYDNQHQSQWHDEGPVTSLYGATVVVVGFGNIGRNFGQRVKAMGAHVIGLRRRQGAVPPEADEMGDMAHFNDYLAQADIVASCLPDTPETYHIYDAARFGAMKKGAYFVNVGRGTNVDQKALRDAVVAGHLAGAALDVTDPEPLPPSDPLWQTPGIYITPHISGGYHLQATHDYIVRIAADNLKRYLAGDPLENIVDLMTGYKA